MNKIIAEIEKSELPYGKMVQLKSLILQIAD
jgi:hypothetical protein